MAWRSKSKVRANAIKHGYRHIDCSEMYRTEHVIGNVLNECLKRKLIKRNDIWITTKIVSNKILRNEDEIRLHIDASLEKLKLDSIDGFLIHSPHTLSKHGERGQDVVNI